MSHALSLFSWKTIREPYAYRYSCHFNALIVCEISYILDSFSVMRMNATIKIIFCLIITLLIFLRLSKCVCGYIVYVVGKLNHMLTVLFDVTREVVYPSLQLLRTCLTKITKEQCLSLIAYASFWNWPSLSPCSQMSSSSIQSERLCSLSVG